jgi:hypothetical protein
MLTDHELIYRARAELAPLSPLAAELVRRFAEDVAAIDDQERAWLGQPALVSIALDLRPTA